MSEEEGGNLSEEVKKWPEAWRKIGQRKASSEERRKLVQGKREKIDPKEEGGNMAQGRKGKIGPKGKEGQLVQETKKFIHDV